MAFQDKTFDLSSYSKAYPLLSQLPLQQVKCLYIYVHTHTHTHTHTFIHYKYILIEQSLSKSKFLLCEHDKPQLNRLTLRALASSTTVAIDHNR